MVELQVAHRLVEGVEKLLLRGKRRDLGLDNYLVARQFRQHEAKLHLAGGKLLLADSYGIAPDGGEVIPPFQQAEILQPDLPRDEQRNNPGIY